MAIQRTEAEQIDVKQAVQKAIAYIRELYQGEALPNLRLEEVEFSESDDRWHVTVGYTVTEQGEQSNALITALGGSATRSWREYKIIEIDAYTGAARSMKIRKL